jgi:hypothetical protein
VASSMQLATNGTISRPKFPLQNSLGNNRSTGATSPTRANESS